MLYQTMNIKSNSPCQLDRSLTTGSRLAADPRNKVAGSADPRGTVRLAVKCWPHITRLALKPIAL
jgi:hypothetical protein